LAVLFSLLFGVQCNFPLIFSTVGISYIKNENMI
jgi:hypothetical protein